MRAIAEFAVRRGLLVRVLWVLVIAGLNLGIPQLDTVISRDSTAFLPAGAPSVTAFKHLDSAFSGGRSQSFVFIAVERPAGIQRGDRAYLQALVARLAKKPQDFSGVPDLRNGAVLDALMSRDRKALYLPIGLPGPVGAPDSATQVEALRAAVNPRPTGLTVVVSGTPATIVDTQNALQRDVGFITLVTVGLIAIILFILYRSVPLTGVVLMFIGVALALGRGLAACASEELHLFHVSTFTASFLTAVVLGAATDYAIFLLGRYHELRRAGVEARAAAVEATVRTSSVVLASGLTVALALASMAFAHISIFTTTGPPVALAILSTLALSLTFLPALVAFAGPRGWLDPKAGRGDAGWGRIGGLVVARPARVLGLGLALLVGLAAFVPLAQVTYDQRRVQPPGTESDAGFRLLDRHFPPNEALADYVVITSAHDLRNSRDLAALEKASAAIASVPGVASVRTVTRPLGVPIPQASLAFQMKQVGLRLGTAATQVTSGVHGAEQVGAGADRVGAGARRAATGAQQLLDGTARLASGLPRLVDGAAAAQGGSARLRDGAAQLADALSSAADQVQVAVDGLGLAYAALNQSLTCGLDPYCSRAREGIGQIYAAERDRLIPGLRRAAAGATKLEAGAGSLSDGLDQLRAGLRQARSGSAQLQSGQRLLADKLGELAHGADLVSAGSGQVANGLGRLGSGLTGAATMLSTNSAAAESGGLPGFFLPPAAFRDPRFATARDAFVSPDGHTARIVAISATNAYDNEAMQRVPQLAGAARTALQGTSLAGARVELTGDAAANADIKALSDEDFDRMALAAFIVVLLILLLLIRSIVMTLFLITTVVLSYAAAVGLGVLVFQILLHQALDWTLPSIAFVLLVAVGADYNMLLVKRMHDEAPNGEREGVARAVATTGRVITAAGLIFAASISAMMIGDVLTLKQIGFTIGVGLLIDTFIVRTLVVPAFAALLGPHLWWPSRPALRAAAADRLPALHTHDPGRGAA